MISGFADLQSKISPVCFCVSIEVRVLQRSDNLSSL